MRKPLPEETLRHLFLIEGKSDQEIAKLYGLTRTAIAKRRLKFGIVAKTSHVISGVDDVCHELALQGYAVINKRNESFLHPFDVLVNDTLRLEVMTSRSMDDKGSFKFTLCNKSLLPPGASSYYTQLSNGRIRKDFTQTCDLIVFVCYIEGSPHFWLIPPSDLKPHQQTVSLRLYGESMYTVYYGDWQRVRTLIDSRTF